MTTTTSGTRSTAIGQFNSASGSLSYAAGFGNSASGTGSAAVGYYNSASGSYSTAIGYANSASGTGATAIGIVNTASGTGAYAGGVANTAVGAYSTAAGLAATAVGAGSYGSRRRGSSLRPQSVPDRDDPNQWNGEQPWCSRAHGRTSSRPTRIVKVRTSWYAKILPTGALCGSVPIGAPSIGTAQAPFRSASQSSAAVTT